MHGLKMDPLPRELPTLPHHLFGVHQRLHFPHVLVTRTPKRCLFGAADPSATRAALESIFKEEAERCIKKWEFDPVADRPVENPKRFSWERLAATPQADPAPTSAETGAVVEGPEPASLPGDAIPLPGMANRVGEPAVSAFVEASANASVDGLRGRVMSIPSGDGAEVPRGDEAERSREARRFAPYRQPRITEYWRQRKCSGEAKVKLTISTDAPGASESEAHQAVDGH